VATGTEFRTIFFIFSDFSQLFLLAGGAENLLSGKNLREMLASWPSNENSSATKIFPLKYFPFLVCFEA